MHLKELSVRLGGSGMMGHVRFTGASQRSTRNGYVMALKFILELRPHGMACLKGTFGIQKSRKK
jgi:hypothetical protein